MLSRKNIETISKFGHQAISDSAKPVIPTKGLEVQLTMDEAQKLLQNFSTEVRARADH